MQFSSQYLKFVNRFYHDLAAAVSDADCAAVLQRFCQRLLDRDENTLVWASAILAVAKSPKCAHLVPNAVPQLHEIEKIAVRAAENEIPSVARRRRSVATLTAFWSSERVQFYHMDMYSIRFLEKLVKAASLYGCWQSFVKATNRYMILRHECSINNSRLLRIGLHYTQSTVTLPESPLLLSDIELVLGGLPREEEEQIEGRIQSWLRPCWCFLRSLGMKNEQMRFYLVKQDVHGLLVPDNSRSIGFCPICVENDQTASDYLLVSEAAPARVSTISRAVEDEGDQSSAEATPQAPTYSERCGDVRPSIQDNPNLEEGLRGFDECYPWADESLVRFDTLSPHHQDQFQRESVAREDSLARSLSARDSFGPSTSTSTSVLLSSIGSGYCRVCSGTCHVCVWSSDTMGQVEAFHEVSGLRGDLSGTCVKYWMNPITIAAIVATTDERDVSSSVRAADAVKVLFETVMASPERDSDLSQVIVFDQNSPPAPSSSVYLYRTALQSIYGDLLLHVRQDQCQVSWNLVETIIEHLNTEILSATGCADVFYIESISRILPCFLTKWPKFQLLDTLFQRRKSRLAAQKETLSYLALSDAQNHMIIDAIRPKGSFQGARVEAVGHKWLRSVFGTCICWIVPHSAMTEADWLEFEASRTGWNPKGKGRALALRPGNMVLIPSMTVYAVLALEPCVTTEGIFWDHGNLQIILQGLFWNARHGNGTLNYRLESQVSHLIEELRIAFELEPDNWPNVGILKSMIHSI
ncbi:unnamed protein product [Periconia digitata]|uniref:JmjC domain-containing protein n=1 Tax=Periconia digitata TaxID=1303443 RepID=A0A9W4XS57_9PLEO|nr:unnamed protein product [Periconia digitata]